MLDMHLLELVVDRVKGNWQLPGQAVMFPGPPVSVTTKATGW